MPNSHRPPDTTRRSCLCRARRCELSLETVWRSLKSQPIDHTAVHSVLTFSWRTTSLRGVAARRSCLPGLRRGGGGRQAGAAVLSCLVWRCELTTRQVRSASECVRRSHCAARHTPTQTRHRTHLSGCQADSIHTVTPDTTKQSCL